MWRVRFTAAAAVLCRAFHPEHSTAVACTGGKLSFYSCRARPSFEIQRKSAQRNQREGHRFPSRLLKLLSAAAVNTHRLLDILLGRFVCMHTYDRKERRRQLLIQRQQKSSEKWHKRKSRSAEGKMRSSKQVENAEVINPLMAYREVEHEEFFPSHTYRHYNTA